MHLDPNAAKQQNEFQKLYRKAQEKRELFFKNLLWPYFQIKLCLKKSNLETPQSCLKMLKKVYKNFIAATRYLPKALVLEIDLSSETLMENTD